MLNTIGTSRISPNVPLSESVLPAPQQEERSIPAKTHPSSNKQPPYPNSLRAWIRREGYTLREVARETGVPEGTMRHWAAGRLCIPHRERERLAHVIGCSVQELVSPPEVAVPQEVDVPMVSSHYTMGYLHGMLAVLSLWQAQITPPVSASSDE